MINDFKVKGKHIAKILDPGIAKIFAYKGALSSWIVALLSRLSWELRRIV